MDFLLVRFALGLQPGFLLAHGRRAGLQNLNQLQRVVACGPVRVGAARLPSLLHTSLDGLDVFLVQFKHGAVRSSRLHEGMFANVPP
jgi:hypothetical protein